jgi:hypothetical protein
MSGFSRVVPALSRSDIAMRAGMLRRQWSLVNDEQSDAFPVTHYIENVLMVSLPSFVFEVVEDHEMVGMEGATWPDQLRMRFPNSVYEAAARNEHRARFTMAHEIGHLMLHGGIPFARGVAQGEMIEPFRDSEWQADEFAGALLMPVELIKPMRSITEIMDRCLVSQQAAVCRLGKLKMNKPHGW